MRRRLLIVLLGLVAGVWGCGPRPSSPPPPIAARAAGPVIYTLVSRHGTLVVMSGRDGPLYSLKDADGRVLVPPSTLDEVAARNPELYDDIRRAVAADSRVMAR
jgi:hypothetical protein